MTEDHAAGYAREFEPPPVDIYDSASERDTHVVHHGRWRAWVSILCWVSAFWIVLVGAAAWWLA